MSHTTTVFERDVLYREVWVEPVRTVAKRYRVSDVALRKICRRLGVPVPPLGYWARIAAGQKPRVTPLPVRHEGETRYVRDVFVDTEAGERERRIAELLARHPMPSEIPVSSKSSVEECLPIVKRTAKALGPRRKDGRGFQHSQDNESFEVAVSEGQRERALLVLDAVIAAATTLGAVVKRPSDEGHRPKLELLGIDFEVGVFEASERLERPLTAKELREQKEGRLYYIPDRWNFRPTGKLKVVIDPHAFLVGPITLSDGAKEPLESRLVHVAARMLAKAAEARVRQEMRDEDERRWREEAARREARERRKAAAMIRIEKVEKVAAAWRRAQDLQAWASALEKEAASRAAAGDQPDVEEVAAEVAWVRRAADWLDPLVQGRLPVADGIEDPDCDDADSVN